MAEAAAREEDPEDEEGGEPKRKLPIVPIVFSLLYVVISFATFGVVYYNLNIDLKNPQTETSEREKRIVEKDQIESFAEKLFPMESFTVNLKGNKGKDHLKVTLQLEVFEPGLVPELTKKLPIIRDTVVEVLSDKNRDEIDSVQEKLFLKSELVTRVNQKLVSGTIRGIYITQFLIQ